MSQRNNDADILHVTDMARKYGKTEAAIRQAVLRDVDWLPKPFRLGSRLVWRAQDVDEFMKKQAEAGLSDGRRSRKGRS